VEERSTQDVRCPVCGRGVLADVGYASRVMSSTSPWQDPDAREVRRYSCGHEWVGPSLARAEVEDLTVERRASEETVGSVDPEDENGGA